jgi:5-methylcytosine-specific restriction endonuclease McrA
MARPQKDGLDYFPVWKPRYRTEERFYSLDFKTRYKALRNSSSGFIKRDDVRNILLSFYENKCVKCGSTENLEIDHIVSVYLCAKGLAPINELNTFKNLTVLCKSCNARRSPDEQTHKSDC